MKEDAIALLVNGEERTIFAGATIAELLASLGIETRKVAVERNRAIVPRSTFAEQALASGDEVEIVRFVGGG